MIRVYLALTRQLSLWPAMDLADAIALADAMAARADQFTLKRVKELANQLRVGCAQGGPRRSGGGKSWN